jgi:hypothetical protein
MADEDYSVEVESNSVRERAYKESVYQKNLQLLSPMARQIYLRENEQHIKLQQESGTSIDKAFIKRVTLEMGIQGSLNAGGRKKGGYNSLNSWDPNNRPSESEMRYGMGAKLEDGIAGSIAQNRRYLARKKGGVGALAGARYGSPEMFPGKFPNIVGGPMNVGFGQSAGGPNIDILTAGRRGFASRTS